MGEYQDDSEPERRLGSPGNEAFVWELLHDRQWQLPTEDVEAGWLEACGEKVSCALHFVLKKPSEATEFCSPLQNRAHHAAGGDAGG